MRAIVESLPTWRSVCLSTRIGFMWGFEYLTRQQFSLNAAAHRLARTPGPTTSPRIVTTALSVLVRLRQSLPSGSLLHAESAITTRLNHQLPRQDSHLLVYQRTKAAQTPSNPDPPWGARRSGGGDGHRFRLRAPKA